MNRFFIVLVVAFVFVPTALWATTQKVEFGNFQQFQHDMNKAYASYRISLFQTNKKNQEKSLKSAVSFQQQWQAITEKYIDTPPDVYANDPEWKTTLLNIGDINALGIQEILVGKLSDAHNTLEAIRDELGALRQRNQVYTFSDHVNNYHEAMETLLLLGLNPNNIGGKSLLIIREKLAVLDYLAEKMLENAPEGYLNDQDFQQTLNDVFDSLKNLRQAVNEKNPDNIIQTIKKLKPAYARLFIKFG